MRTSAGRAWARGRVLRWVVALAWAALPATVWPAVGDALRGRSAPVHLTAAIGSWAVWAGVLLALLVLHPVSLTVVRCATPAALGAAVAGLASGRAGPAAAATAIGWSAVTATASCTSGFATAFVNGPAYHGERRFPLAPPGPLLLGPLELAWAAVVGLPVTAALLLAARQWAAGGACLAAGALAVPRLARSLHRLSCRWLVFVPAGIVLHDPLTLADPPLLMRADVSGIGPPGEPTSSVDVRQGAPGLGIELVLANELPIALVRPRHEPEGRGVTGFVVAPTRPGAVLAEASHRRYAVRVVGPRGERGQPLGHGLRAAPPPSTRSPS